MQDSAGVRTAIKGQVNMPDTKRVVKGQRDERARRVYDVRELMLRRMEMGCEQLKKIIGCWLSRGSCRKAGAIMAGGGRLAAG